MNKLSTEKRANIVRCLVEGNSIRSTSRITGASKNTISKLLVDLGYACTNFQDHRLNNLNCERVQVDEIWSFVGCKRRNATPEKKMEKVCGDCWTWTAIDADSKLAVCWLVGERDGETAQHFLYDLSQRVEGRFQLTSDAFKSYVENVRAVFADEVDYAQLVKIYGKSSETATRYSPAQCMGARKAVISGNPEKEHISTSFVERQNLTMRMSMRRFTRLTNAFSKKIENHEHAIALHFMYYNFCRVHQTLGETPAMRAGVADKVWKIEDIVNLLD